MKWFSLVFVSLSASVNITVALSRISFEICYINDMFGEDGELHVLEGNHPHFSTKIHQKMSLQPLKPIQFSRPRDPKRSPEHKPNSEGA